MRCWISACLIESDRKFPHQQQTNLKPFSLSENRIDKSFKAKMSDVDDMIEDDYDPNELVRVLCLDNLFAKLQVFSRHTSMNSFQGLFVRIYFGAGCRSGESILQLQGSQRGQPDERAQQLQTSARDRTGEGRMGLSSAEANDQDLFQASEWSLCFTLAPFQLILQAVVGLWRAITPKWWRDTKNCSPTSRALWWEITRKDPSTPFLITSQLRNK